MTNLNTKLVNGLKLTGHLRQQMDSLKYLGLINDVK